MSAPCRLVVGGGGHGGRARRPGEGGAEISGRAPFLPSPRAAPPPPVAARRRCCQLLAGSEKAVRGARPATPRGAARGAGAGAPELGAHELRPAPRAAPRPPGAPAAAPRQVGAVGAVCRRRRAGGRRARAARGGRGERAPSPPSPKRALWGEAPARLRTATRALSS